MWDSKVSDYDIVDGTPYGKDVLKMLADECEREGITLFFYHSHLDWHHPDYFPLGRTGQHSGRREGGDFDWDVTFATAAETGTALEINADPARLDLDPKLARIAAEAGCLITINSDAHWVDGFDTVEFGVMMARKAWLKPAQVLNAWEPERVLLWLRDRAAARR